MLRGLHNENFEATTLGTQFEAGLVFDFNDYIVEPRVTANWTHAEYEDFTDSMGLYVDPVPVDTATVMTGLRIGGEYEVEHGILDNEETLLHPYLDLEVGMRGVFTEENGVTVAGYEFRHDTAGFMGNAAVGLEAELSDRLDFNVEARYQGGEHRGGINA